MTRSDPGNRNKKNKEAIKIRKLVKEEISRSGLVPPTKAYKKKEARKLWVHEDKLINERIQWLGFTQGLLFASYALSFRVEKAVLDSNAGIKNFITIIPWAGLLVSILAVIGIFAAIVAMYIINNETDWSGKSDRRFGVSYITTLLGFLCAVGFPLVFCGAWLTIIMVK